MTDAMQRLWMQIYGDKKKFSLICLLVFVGLLLWGRLLLKRVPRTAIAEPAASGSAAAPTAPPPALSGRAGAAVVELDRSVRLQRDLFAADPAIYGKSAPEKPKPTKSPHRSADKRLRAVAVRGEARELALQSVMAGQRPRVMINGEILRIGQSIAGFKVVRMSRRYVVLEKHGIQVRLGM